MTTKAQQLVEEVRKRKEAEALASATGDDTSALDDLMGDIMGGGDDAPAPTIAPDATTPDTATPEVTTKVTEPVDDGFITIVPVDQTKAPTGIVIEDLQIGDAPLPPTTTEQPAPEAPKARQTRTNKPKVTETPTEVPKIGVNGAPLTRAQQRTLDELEAGRRTLAKRG